MSLICAVMFPVKMWRGEKKKEEETLKVNMEEL